MARLTRKYSIEWDRHGADREENQPHKQCRKVPVNMTHQTEEGRIRLVVRAVRDGWRGTFVGQQLEGGRNFDNMADANEYVLAAFRLMFPDHECDERCSHGRPRQL